MLEFHTMELCGEPPPDIHDMGHCAVHHHVAVGGHRELQPIVPRQKARCVVSLIRPFGQDDPVGRIESMPVPIFAQDVGRVIHGIGRDRDELHQILHRPVVDRSLDRRDLFRMERADIRATGVNKMQDNHLVAEIRQAHGIARRILQPEIRGLCGVDGLEVWLHLEHPRIQIFTRMIGEGRRGDRGHKCRQGGAPSQTDNQLHHLSG